MFYGSLLRSQKIKSYYHYVLNKGKVNSPLNKKKLTITILLLYYIIIIVNNIIVIVN